MFSEEMKVRVFREVLIIVFRERFYYSGQRKDLDNILCRRRIQIIIREIQIIEFRRKIQIIAIREIQIIVFKEIS